ncbi:MAG: hypothetical protein ACLFNK_04180 [Candidatus Woesearchaeota archaeon]
MRFMKGVKDGSRLFGEMLSGLVNTALLTLVYLLVLTPTAILAKIVGKRFLNLDITKKSRWKNAESIKTKERYYRQF